MCNTSAACKAHALTLHMKACQAWKYAQIVQSYLYFSHLIGGFWRFSLTSLHFCETIVSCTTLHFFSPCKKPTTREISTASSAAFLVVQNKAQLNIPLHTQQWENRPWRLSILWFHFSVCPGRLAGTVGAVGLARRQGCKEFGPCCNKS